MWVLTVQAESIYKNRDQSSRFVGCREVRKPFRMYSLPLRNNPSTSTKRADLTSTITVAQIRKIRLWKNVSPENI